MSLNTVPLLMVLACLVVTVPRAHADVFIRYLPSDIAKPTTASQAGTQTQPQPADPPPRHGNLDIFVAQGRALLTGKARSGQEYSIWFNSADGTFHVLERSHRGVFEVSRASFAALEAGRQRLRRDRDAKIAKSPQQDHEKIKRFADGLETRLFGARPRLAEYRTTDNKVNSGTYACTRTEVVVDQRKIRELCSTKHSELNIADNDWSVLAKMHRIGKEIAAATDIGARLIPRFVLDLAHGVPVKINYLEPGARVKDLVLQQVSNKKIALDKLVGHQAYRNLPLPTHRPNV